MLKPVIMTDHLHPPVEFASHTRVGESQISPTIDKETYGILEAGNARLRRANRGNSVGVEAAAVL